MKRFTLALIVSLALAGAAQAQCTSCGLGFNRFGGFGVAPVGFNSFSVGGAFLQPAPVLFAQQQLLTPVVAPVGFGGANIVNVGFGGRRFFGGGFGFGAGFNTFGGVGFNNFGVGAVGLGGNFQQINEQRGLFGRVRSRQITQINGGLGGANVANVGGRRFGRR